MIDSARSRESLEKLLKLARGDADALRIDLADIDKAQHNAKASLTNLERSAKAEEAACAKTAPADLGAYLEGVRARRHNLRTTLATLSDAENKARDRLEAAFIEIKKLEHLIEIFMRDARKVERRRDLTAMDEIAALRARKA